MDAKRITIAVTMMLMTAAPGLAQRFNIDLDQAGTFPSHGNGSPSASFGAAAGQAGVWNTVDAQDFGPTPLLDTSGSATGVTIAITATSMLPTSLSFWNTSNTGDFALLLNDATQIGTASQGGSRTYTFSGLTPGPYQIYTYAVAPQGTVGTNPVFVPGSTSTNPQDVTGPMPGNAFALGITHSLHDVMVTTGTLSVMFSVPPNLPSGAFVNGFQLVPEPGTVSLLALGGLALLRKRRTVSRLVSSR